MQDVSTPAERTLCAQLASNLLTPMIAAEVEIPRIRDISTIGHAPGSVAVSAPKPVPVAIL